MIKPASAKQAQIARLLVKIGLGVVAVVLLSFGLLIGRLMIADLSGDWLKTAVLNRIDASKPDAMSVDFETLSIGLSGGRPVARFGNLAVIPPNRLVDLQADTAVVIIDPISLIFGPMRVAQIDLIGGSIDTTLPYMENGPLQRPIPFGVAFIDTGLQIVRSAVDGQLGTVNLADMRVSFNRPEWTRPATYYTTNVAMTWRDEGLDYEGRFVGSDGSWSVSLTRDKPIPGSTDRRMTLSVRDVVPRDLVGNPQRVGGDAANTRDGFETGGFVLAIDMDARFDADGQVAHVDTEVRSGLGWVGPQQSPVASVDEMVLDFSWTRGREEFDVKRLVVNAGRTAVEATGSFRPPWFTTTGRGEFLLSAEAPVFAFNTDDQAVETIGVQAHGFMDLKTGELVLTRADLVTQEAALAARGRFSFANEFPELSFAAKLRDVGFENALALWPPVFGAEAREWAETHIHAGRIDSAALAFRLGRAFFDGDASTLAWTADDMKGSFELSGIDLMVTETLPVVPGLNGVGQMAGGRIELITDPLSTQMDSGRGITLKNGRVVFDDLRRSPEILVAAELSAENAAIAEVFEGFLPKALDEVGLAAGDLTGEGTVAAEFVFSTEAGGADGPARWRLTGDAKGLGSTTKVQGREVSDGELSFEVDQDRAKVAGSIALDGVPAEIDIDRTLIDLQGGIASGVAFTLNAETRERLGIDLGDALTGSIEARLVDTSAEGTRRFEVDLTKAGISLPPLGFAKKVGDPAQMVFDLAETGDDRRIENLTFQTNRPILAGSAVLDSEGIKSVDLNTIRITQGDDVALTAEREGDGFAIALTGRQLDLRPIFTSLKTPQQQASDAASGLPALVISASVERVLGHYDIVASGLRLDAVLDEGAPRSIRLNTQLNDQPLTFTWAPDGNWTVLDLKTQDIGGLLRFVDAYSRVRGGVAEITGRLPRAGNSETGTGTLSVSEFVLVDQDRIQRLEARISDTNRRNLRISSDTESLRDAGNGISFDRLIGAFSQTGPVLTISELTLQGQTLGAAASGAVDLEKRQLDLRGTFIPLYGLNNLFGRLPVLGQILGGGSRGGLLGLTFRSFGPISGPELSINPASLLAPGIFRKVFGFEPFNN